MYERARISSSVRYRWWMRSRLRRGCMVARFRATGVLDLNGSYRLISHITAGADVANLLDNDHYEAFGGDLLGRRALGHVRNPGKTSSRAAFAAAVAPLPYRGLTPCGARPWLPCLQGTRRG